MYIGGKGNLILKHILIAAIIFAANFCVVNTCFALDSEAIFSTVDINEYNLPKDIKWNNREISDKDEAGHNIRYVLKDKRVQVYVDDELIWLTDRKFLVQDFYLEDIDAESNQSMSKGNKRVNGKNDKELVLLLWKEGRYGVHKPFWILNDEKQFSQHIFTYNLDKKGKRMIAKWGSSYMGDEATDITFKDGIMYLKHKANKESAWKWYSFGFEKLEPVKIMAAGDNLIHDFIYLDAINNHKGDFEYLYKKAEKYTKEADLSVINLETPLMKDEKNYSTYPCFGSPVRVAEGLKKAGFDAVTLSNNHRLDKGAQGVDETLETLDYYGLLHVGSMDDKPYLLIKRNEIVFALMNYTYGTNGIRPKKGYENAVNYLDDEERISKEIKEAKGNSDFVIVFPHWGAEYITEPNYHEKQWRDVFYEAGADLVIGTHPHIIQGYEMYKRDNSKHEMLIYYSLGNYISANQRAEHNSGGLAFVNVGLTLDGPEIVSYDFEEIDTIYKSSKY